LEGNEGIVGNGKKSEPDKHENKPHEVVTALSFIRQECSSRHRRRTRSVAPNKNGWHEREEKTLTGVASPHLKISPE